MKKNSEVRIQESESRDTKSERKDASPDGDASRTQTLSVGDSDPRLNCCTTKYTIWWGCKNTDYSDRNARILANAALSAFSVKIHSEF